MLNDTLLFNDIENRLKQEIVNLYPVKEQGNINDTFVLETSANRYILQRPKKSDLNEIKSYLDNLYLASGFLAKGMRYEFRNIEEKVKLYHDCNLLKLNVPKILYWNSNYTLIEYIDGIPYNNLNKDLSHTNINELYKMLFKSHSYNIVFGDRWAGNLLVASDGNIHFIDFDIKYVYESVIDMACCRNFEIAVLTYDLMLYAADKNRIADSIIKIFSNEWFRYCYDMHQILGYLYGYLRFYCDENKPRTQTSVAQKQHLQVLDFVKNLEQELL